MVQRERNCILSASSSADDHFRLGQILAEPPIRTASSVQEALRVLRDAMLPVIIAERDLPGGTWRELLQQTQSLASQPFVIVSSAHADEYLWAEALNLGAFDVLSKPFDPFEVSRVVGWACFRWREVRALDIRTERRTRFISTRVVGGASIG